MNNITVIGCDGTNTNVGRKSGVIVQLEKLNKKPFQWCICLLHMNELPLRHLVKNFDGETSGPKSFTGPLGKMLANVVSMPVVNFVPVCAEDICIHPDILSTDQKYLLRMFNSVKEGYLDTSLSLSDPGNISHARWLTTANRFLRLYVATETPSEALIRIVHYIMKCYMFLHGSILKLRN